MTSRAVVLANLASSNILEVDSTTDRVGIGSTQPTTRLDVSGNIKAVHGNFTGVVTATSFVGDGSSLTGVANTNFIVGTAITMTTGTFNGPVTIGGTLTYEDVTNIDSVGIITARSDVSIADKIVHTSDTNTAIRFPAADTFTVETAGSERLRVDSSGRVMIQNTAASSLNAAADDLVVGSGSASGGITVYTGNSDQGALYFADGTNGTEPYAGGINYGHSDNQLRFLSNGSTYMRLDSSGRLLLGTSTSPTAGNGQYANIVVQGYPNTAAGAGHISLQRGQTAFGADNQIGLINFGDSTGASYAGIECYADADSGSSDYPGRLVFSTTADGAPSPTERLRITSAGAVLINSTSAATSDTFLELKNTASHTELNIISKNDSGSLINMGDTDDYNIGRIKYDNSTNSMQFNTNNSERLRITSDGKFGFNTTTPNYTVDINGEVGVTEGQPVTWHDGSGNAAAQIYGDSSSNLILRTGTSGMGERLRITSGGNIGLGGITNPEDYNASANSLVSGGGITLANTTQGSIFFADSASGTGEYVGQINYFHSGNEMTFVNNNSERMRLLTNGEIGFNCTSRPSSGNHNGIFFDSNIITIGSDTSAGQDRMRFETPSGRVGAIQTSGNSTTYTTSSDYRLKENVALISDGLTRLKQLKPCRFNFIGDKDKTVDGFLAHEAQTVVPEAVTGTHNEVDGDGNAVMQGIDQSKLVPLLTAALQEAIAEIESLKTRVAALESS
tara:strand:+ start:1323 stop:3521 length:2199 start_codon:yes stop_codon:yes gene_type:complete